MKKVWATYATALVAACLVAYLAGRSRAAPQLSHQQTRPAVEPAAEAAMPGREEQAARFRDLRVTGFATIDFAEAADLVQAASNEQKERWAQEIAGLPDGPQKRLAAIGFYATWIQFDAPAACASIASSGDRLIRDLIVSSVAAAAPAAAMPPLAELVLRFTAFEQQRVLPGVLREWAVTDPAAAARFIAQHPDSIEARAVGNIVADWAEVSPSGAREWLEANERFLTDAQVVGAFVEKWLETDSAAAIDYVRAHAASDGFEDALKSVMSVVYRGGIDQALEFIESLPAEAQSSAFDDLLNSNRDDPAELARMVTWAARLPEGENDTYAGLALAGWARRDEQGALEWISRQPSPDRNRYVMLLLTGGARLTARTASLALSLPDENEREQAIRSLLERFEDADEARRAIAELHLPRKQTSALLRMTEPER